MVKRMRILLVGVSLCALLGVSACVSKPAVNTNGTPTTAAEQVAGGAYGAYIAADTAWLAYLTTAPKPDPVLIAAVEPRRKAARAALDTYSAAAVKGNAAAEQAAFTLSLKALTDALTAGGVPVKGT